MPIAVAGVLSLVMRLMLSSNLCILQHVYINTRIVSAMPVSGPAPAEQHVITRVLWQGRTPLHIAAMLNKDVFVDLMMDNGADPTLQDHEVAIICAHKTSKMLSSGLTVVCYI